MLRRAAGPKQQRLSYSFFSSKVKKKKKKKNLFAVEGGGLGCSGEVGRCEASRKAGALGRGQGAPSPRAAGAAPGS